MLRNAVFHGHMGSFFGTEKIDKNFSLSAVSRKAGRPLTPAAAGRVSFSEPKLYRDLGQRSAQRSAVQRSWTKTALSYLTASKLQPVGCGLKGTECKLDHPGDLAKPQEPSPASPQPCP